MITKAVKSRCLNFNGDLRGPQMNFLQQPSAAAQFMQQQRPANGMPAGGSLAVQSFDGGSVSYCNFSYLCRMVYRRRSQKSDIASVTFRTPERN